MPIKSIFCLFLRDSSYKYLITLELFMVLGSALLYLHTTTELNCLFFLNCCCHLKWALSICHPHIRAIVVSSAWIEGVYNVGFNNGKLLVKLENLTTGNTVFCFFFVFWKRMYNFKFWVKINLKLKDILI